MRKALLEHTRSFKRNVLGLGCLAAVVLFRSMRAQNICVCIFVCVCVCVCVCTFVFIFVCSTGMLYACVRGGMHIPYIDIYQHALDS